MRRRDARADGDSASVTYALSGTGWPRTLLYIAALLFAILVLSLLSVWLNFLFGL